MFNRNIFDESIQRLQAPTERYRDALPTTDHVLADDDQLGDAWSKAITAMRVAGFASDEKARTEALEKSKAPLLGLGTALNAQFADLWLDELLKDSIEDDWNDLYQVGILLLLAACDSRARESIVDRLHEIQGTGHLSTVVNYLDDIREMLRKKKIDECVPWTPPIKRGVEELASRLGDMKGTSARTIQQRLKDERWYKKGNQFKSNDDKEQLAILSRLRSSSPDTLEPDGTFSS